MGEEKPIVDPLTGAKSLPMEEKLKILDKEIRRLHNECTNAGYKPDKIREVASPVLKIARRGRMKKTARIFIYAMLVALVCVGLKKNETTSYAISVAYKKVMVYWVLPYYDWTWLFLGECLIENPYYEPPANELSEDNCTICKDLTKIVSFSNASPDEITEMIYNMEPAIITDAMSDWRGVVEGINLETIIKLYATDERTMNVTGEKQTNHFRTTIGLPSDIRNVTSLAKWIYSESLEGRHPNFSAQWSNVNTGSYKAFHYYYTKPYFLPSMCEALRTLSYVMLARQNTTEKLKGLLLRPRMDDMGIWIAQISGRFEFILKPVKLCEKICPMVRFALKQGEILNVPTGLYQITYRANSSEGVGIGVGYEFQ